MTQIEDIRSGLASAKRLAGGFVKSPTNPLAISSEEICALVFLLSCGRSSIRRVVELGTYTGFTANLLADWTPPATAIEIYDLFQHNDTSREHLRDHPSYDPADFYEVWRHNTRMFADRFSVYRGDLNETKHAQTEPIDLLFVDIVKHESLVNTVVDPFYDRVRVGGTVLHQDYYHYQSPWIVYQMELLDGPFVLVGDFGNNMSIYVKRRPLTEEEKSFDYVNGLTFAQKYWLLDRAINRHPGLRAGNLKASKLRLSVDDPGFDSESLHREILSEFSHNQRITGYVNEIMSQGSSLSERTW